MLFRSASEPKCRGRLDTHPRLKSSTNCAGKCHGVPAWSAKEGGSVFRPNVGTPGGYCRSNVTDDNVEWIVRFGRRSFAAAVGNGGAHHDLTDRPGSVRMVARQILLFPSILSNSDPSLAIFSLSLSPAIIIVAAINRMCTCIMPECRRIDPSYLLIR